MIDNLLYYYWYLNIAILSLTSIDMKWNEFILKFGEPNKLMGLKVHQHGFQTSWFPRVLGCAIHAHTILEYNLPKSRYLGWE